MLMCLRDLITTLRQDGLTPTEAQVRWAINSGKVRRPPMNGALQFDFGEEHLAELRAYFRRPRAGRGNYRREAVSHAN